MLQLRLPHALPIRAPLSRSHWNRIRLTPLFIRAGALGSALSMVVITIDGALRPGYSAITDVISDLGKPPHAWILNMDLIATGLLIMLFGIGVRGAMGHALGRKSANVMTALVLAAGAGVVSDGVFTEEDALQLHNLSFYVAFSALTLAFFVVGVRLLLSREDHHRLRRYGWYTLVTGLVVLLLIINYVAVPPFSGKFQGLIERMIVGAAFAWQCVTAYRLVKPHRRNDMASGARPRWPRPTRGLSLSASRADGERTDEHLNAA